MSVLHTDGVILLLLRGVLADNNRTKCSNVEFHVPVFPSPLQNGKTFFEGEGDISPYNLPYSPQLHGTHCCMVEHGQSYNSGLRVSRLW